MDNLNLIEDLKRCAFLFKSCWCFKNPQEESKMEFLRNTAWYRERARKAKLTQYPPGLEPEEKKELLDTTGVFVYSEIR
jgi:hypothetical protein